MTLGVHAGTCWSRGDIVKAVLREWTKRIISESLRWVGLDLGGQGRRDLRWLQKLGINTVLDVGANTGQFAMFIRSQLPRAHIYSFEPLSSCYDQLKREMSKDSNFHAINIALGDRTEKSPIFRHRFTPTSSFLEATDLLRADWPAATTESVEFVSVRRLDDVVPELEIAENVLLKLDVQGYERKVLDGATETLRRCEAIITEVSFEERYRGQPLFGDISEILVQAGFIYKGSLDQQLSRVDGRAVEADAVFARVGEVSND